MATQLTDIATVANGNDPGAILNIKNLKKYFHVGGGMLGGEGLTIRAVDDVRFDVQPGEVFGLLGPNGAGKTTTLRIIMGLLQPTAGVVEVDGFDVSQFPLEVKQRIGLVSASAGLYQWLSVEEMLLFFADMYGVGAEVAKARLAQLADVFQIGKCLAQRCGGLSTGQKQRVNLVRALIHDPPVLLMD